MILLKNWTMKDKEIAQLSQKKTVGLHTKTVPPIYRANAKVKSGGKWVRCGRTAPDSYECIQGAHNAQKTAYSSLHTIWQTLTLSAKTRCSCHLSHCFWCQSNSLILRCMCLQENIVNALSTIWPDLPLNSYKSTKLQIKQHSGDAWKDVSLSWREFGRKPICMSSDTNRYKVFHQKFDFWSDIL